MTTQRLFIGLMAGLLLLTCINCRAEQVAGITVARTLSEQSFQNSQWIFFKGIDMDLGYKAKHAQDLAGTGIPFASSRRVALHFDSLQVRKSIMNITAGLIGLGMGLGHAHMEQDQAQLLNLATISFGMNAMMEGIRALSQHNGETVSIKRLEDIGQSSISNRGIKMTVRPAVSLDSSVGIEFRAKF